MASFGYRGAIRTDRDDTPTGILKDAWGPSFPEAEMKAEQVTLARRLRKLSESRATGTDRLHFFGFDLDAVPGGGYEDIEELLAAAHRNPVVGELRAVLRRVTGESIGDEIARLDRAVAFIETHHSHLDTLLEANASNQVLQSTLGLRDSFLFLRGVGPATEWTALKPAMAEREEGMFRRVGSVLTHLGPEEKVILQGHASHLSKDWSAVKPPALIPSAEGSVGTRVHRAFPGQVFSIWMLNGRGRDSQPYRFLSSEFHLIPGTLNALLAEIGSCFLLPTTSANPRARLLSREVDISWMHSGVFRTAVAQQADVLFFVRDVTPLRGEREGQTFAEEPR